MNGATGPLSKKAVESFGEEGQWFESIDELADSVIGSVGDGDVVLVKGSRSMGMERVVEALTCSDESADNDKARSA